MPDPQHFYIDIGDVCNLRCPFCVTGNKSADAPGQLMTLENYLIILDKIKRSAKLVSLYNWGEPLLNPAVFDMIRSTSILGIKTHIDSNLSFKRFDSASAMNMIRSGLSSIFISFDGVTQSVYEKYRVRGRIDLVIKNIRTLQDAKMRVGTTTPFVGLQYHVHRGNKAEMPAARQIALALGVPISFKRLSAPRDWDSSYHYCDDMYIEHEPSMAATYNPPAAKEYVDRVFHSAIKSPCHQMFNGTLTVNTNGGVYPCTTVQGKVFEMGNLITENLDEIWNGENFNVARGFLDGFGPVQNSGSPCETQACPLELKCDVS